MLKANYFKRETLKTTQFCIKFDFKKKQEFHQMEIWWTCDHLWNMWTLADDALFHKLGLLGECCDEIGLNFGNLVYNTISIRFSISVCTMKIKMSLVGNKWSTE